MSKRDGEGYLRFVESQGLQISCIAISFGMDTQGMGLATTCVTLSDIIDRQAKALDRLNVENRKLTEALQDTEATVGALRWRLAIAERAPLMYRAVAFFGRIKGRFVG